MKVKTSELTGLALDWVVAKAHGKGIDLDDPSDPWLTVDGIADQPLHSFTPSTDWAQGGPIIDSELISTETRLANANAANPYGSWEWRASCVTEDDIAYWHDGPTVLIAAMRCFVASRLGEEVEIPEEISR